MIYEMGFATILWWSVERGEVHEDRRMGHGDLKEGKCVRKRPKHVRPKNCNTVDCIHVLLSMMYIFMAVQTFSCITFRAQKRGISAWM